MPKAVLLKSTVYNLLIKEINERHNISNNTIDNIYNEAKDVGAYGGKLLGAGGGGFMLFYIKKELQDKLRGRLKNLLEIPFKFDEEGSKIIYKTN